MKEIEFLFGNHEFWENTRKKYNLPEGSLSMGNIIIKYDLVVINLTKTSEYSNITKEDFDEVLAKTIAHEIVHFEIMEENLNVSEEQEEYIINRLIPIKIVVEERFLDPDTKEIVYKKIHVEDTC